MTDEQKSRFAALQDAWSAIREKRRRAEAAELDAADLTIPVESARLRPPRQWRARGLFARQPPPRRYSSGRHALPGPGQFDDGAARKGELSPRPRALRAAGERWQPLPHR